MLYSVRPPDALGMTLAAMIVEMHMSGTAMASNALISGRFIQFRRAEAAIGRLSSHAALEPQTLELVEPMGAGVASEPPSRQPGGRESLLRRHLVRVALGLGAGIAAWSILVYSGLNSFGATPGYGLAVTIFFGAFFGLLMCAASGRRQASGLRLREDADCGQWTVIVHCRDGRRTGLVCRILAEESEKGDTSITRM